MPATSKLRLIALALLLAPLAYAQTDPTQFVFGPFSSLAPYNNANNYTMVADSQIQPANLVTNYNTFASTGDFTVLRHDDPTTTFSVSGNVGTITTGTAATANYVIGSSASSFVGPNAFIQVEIDQNGTTSGTDHIAVGIANAADAVEIDAEVDMAGHLAFIHVLSAGVDHVISSVGFTPPSAPWKLGFSLINGHAIAWSNSGSGWSKITSGIVTSFYDPTVTGNLSGFESSLKFFTSQAATWKVSNLKTGIYGGTGFANEAVVINPDGSPYVIGNLLYVLASIGTPESNGTDFSGSSQGVFTFDLNTNAITQISSVMTQRGGHIYNDTAGQIIVNSVTGTQQFLTSTWGDASSSSTVVQVYGSNSSSTVDALAPGVHIIPTTVTMSTPQGTNLYDPFMVCSSWSATTGACASWLLADVLGSGITPYLYTSTSDPSANSWTAVGSGPINGEGSRIECLIVGGVKTYFPAWGYQVGSSTRRIDIYNSSMTLLGSINAPLNTLVTQSPWNPPHANLFAFGNTEYFLSFDDTQYQTYGESLGNAVLSTASLTTANACFATNPGTPALKSILLGNGAIQGDAIIQ